MPLVSEDKLIKDEIRTAHVINAVMKFMRAHPNQWPKSWEELGDEYKEFDNSVKMRFDITVSDLDRGSIRREILLPYHGEFRYKTNFREMRDEFFELFLPTLRKQASQ